MDFVAEEIPDNPLENPYTEERLKKERDQFPERHFKYTLTFEGRVYVDCLSQEEELTTPATIEEILLESLGYDILQQENPRQPLETEEDRKIREESHEWLDEIIGITSEEKKITKENFEKSIYEIKVFLGEQAYFDLMQCVLHEMEVVNVGQMKKIMGDDYDEFFGCENN